MSSLRVEFRVIETIDRPYGYQEKIIQYRNNPTKYKAIIKDGDLVAILGKRYKLIPNEQVIDITREISEAMDLEFLYYLFGWRVYCVLKDNDIGVLVINSVDGTESLKCEALFYSDEIGIIPPKSITNVYRKHSESLEISELYDIIPEVLDNSREYKGWFESLSNYKVKDYVDSLKEMVTILPKKYREGCLEYTYFNPEYSIKDMYELIARRIWSNDIDMRTKINLYKTLNQIVAAIGLAVML